MTEEQQAIQAEIVETQTVHEPDAASQWLPTAYSSDSIQLRRRRSTLLFLMLPILFLTVTLLGGMRLSGADGSFVFLPPSLICLVFGAVVMVLFFRVRLVDFAGWFSERRRTLELAANGVVIVTVFCASVQMFNSLLPERGLPFWTVGFCFLWTLWTYLFADFEAHRLLRSLGSLLGMAFFVKYLVLANLTAPVSEGWLQGILQNPSKEAMTWMLDLPRYSGGTGYIQFFTVVIYLAGLFLLPRSGD